jgi:hypothetical protein
LKRSLRLPLAPLLLAAPFILAWAAAQEEKNAASRESPEAARSSEAPAPVEVRGKLVCLAEEMRDRYRAEVPPVHDHLLGLREESKDGGPTYVSILRTPIAEGLFVDDRFRKEELVLTGRRFPGTAIIEVTRYRALRSGKLIDFYYWCDVCSIQGVNPASCACCQAPVELREKPVE